MVAATDIRPVEGLGSLKVVDPIWDSMREEARAAADRDPLLAAFLYSTIINHRSLEECVIYRICERLDHPDMQGILLRQTFEEMLSDWPEWGSILRVDIQAIYDRDPACLRFLEPVLYFKGFHALQTHRLAHWLLNRGRRDFALYLQSRSSSVFQTDINPAARIGKGIFLDHATGLVVGETAVIGDNVSILHGVTLGGTGKEGSDRHPKIAHGVLIGAGAKILGNIQIGHCSRIAAGSVVLKEVPPKTTVAGVPAKVVGEAGCSEPSRSMDQLLAEKIIVDQIMGAGI
ncbi:serine O-acetyltransferase [Agrobacterium sp. SHOUNA12C]|uniref:Serine acetyltransferase n=2 Tax=Rhizobium rhizogenes TaxID=359 RepID=B9JEN0_RHIR8|nr:MULTISPECIES: serine O-acetyltransferase [Rhizobium]ACM26450.1 serine acetyltransferase protein [Rhizobium rhizogenes K84]KAA6490706.1 serine O-acetyltransferase [Agrobacterium sp. ICMP 7243]MCJ9724412.1 serine O-acetyltransferase [Agrobacterium sp. BETTINA12B]MCJ9759267.1 serine O-acetyltransferase [Agrobacterium sp. SHOUNA12C]OCJ06218.1 serine O-acetyltransferase [Agrobacterium sp. 13-626]OCJ25588.1 serine O-acetyltransferase [Agrobacterium sp. B131/95]OCJ31327.1 serine O-acetyltransfer